MSLLSKLIPDWDKIWLELHDKIRQKPMNITFRGTVTLTLFDYKGQIGAQLNISPEEVSAK